MALVTSFTWPTATQSLTDGQASPVSEFVPGATGRSVHVVWSGEVRATPVPVVLWPTTVHMTAEAHDAAVSSFTVDGMVWVVQAVPPSLVVITTPRPAED